MSTWSVTRLVVASNRLLHRPPRICALTFCQSEHYCTSTCKSSRICKRISSPFSYGIGSAPCIKTGNRFFNGMEVNRNKGMVEKLKRDGIIQSSDVAKVMQKVDRALFVPWNDPYFDSPMPIGYGATISAPHMHAMCLELLKDSLKPGMLALDVGSGTGYLTACFALMVGPSGRAVGVEHIPELVKQSIENIRKSEAASLLKEGSISIHEGDGRNGWSEFAPYDAIHVGAAASEVPQQLIDQLKPGGTMVIPVGDLYQDLTVIHKKEDGSLSRRTGTSVRYVPLTDRESQRRAL